MSIQVGLKVDPNWQSNMVSKYRALLDRMANSDMPEDAVYRVTMEKVIRYRLEAAMEHPEDPEKVEELCNCGQVEELVVQAEDEMQVLEMYLRGRYWEQVQDVDIEYNPNPEDDHGDDIEWGDTPETMHAETKV
jgi:NADH dehydrogenase (ubiquinone) 1 alpha subcomplex subunit 5